MSKASKAGEAIRDSITAVLAEPAPAEDRPQGDEFEYFDRESLILLIKSQRERIAELMADGLQGEWIADKQLNIWGTEVDCYRCSSCRSKAINHSLIMDTTGLNYCPTCGAKMKGADDE